MQRYVEKYEQCLYSVAYDVTGIDAMPRSVHMLRWEEAGERILPAPMFSRQGEPKRFTRKHARGGALPTSMREAVSGPISVVGRRSQWSVPGARSCDDRRADQRPCAWPGDRWV